MKTQEVFKGLIAETVNMDYVKECGKTIPWEVFVAEKKGDITVKSVEDWFRGMASCCPVPFADQEIKGWLDSKGLKGSVDTYWFNCAKAFYSLYKPAPKPVWTGQKHMLVVKEWYDRVNGNTYYAARVYRDSVCVLKLPFEYGYGNQSYFDAAREIQTMYENGETIGREDLISEEITIPKCTKKDVKEWGGEE